MELNEVLENIKDKVIVTGSYAEGTQTEDSDIDLFIRNLPEDKCDYENGIDSYFHELLESFKESGFDVTSCGPLTFAVRDLPIMLDFSSLFEVDLDNTFEIEIEGVKMIAARSLYNE